MAKIALVEHVKDYTYSKSETNTLVNNKTDFKDIVLDYDSLPTEGLTIGDMYLVGSTEPYEQYIYTENGFVQAGSVSGGDGYYVTYEEYLEQREAQTENINALTTQVNAIEISDCSSNRFMLTSGSTSGGLNNTLSIIDVEISGESEDDETTTKKVIDIKAVNGITSLGNDVTIEAQTYELTDDDISFGSGDLDDGYRYLYYDNTSESVGIAHAFVIGTGLVPYLELSGELDCTDDIYQSQENIDTYGETTLSDIVNGGTISVINSNNNNNKVIYFNTNKSFLYQSISLTCTISSDYVNGYCYLLLADGTSESVLSFGKGTNTKVYSFTDSDKAVGILGIKLYTANANYTIPFSSICLYSYTIVDSNIIFQNTKHSNFSVTLLNTQSGLLSATSDLLLLGHLTIDTNTNKLSTIINYDYFDNHTGYEYVALSNVPSKLEQDEFIDTINNTIDEYDTNINSVMSEVNTFFNSTPYTSYIKSAVTSSTSLTELGDNNTLTLVQDTVTGNEVLIINECTVTDNDNVTIEVDTQEIDITDVDSEYYTVTHEGTLYNDVLTNHDTLDTSYTLEYKDFNKFIPESEEWIYDNMYQLADRYNANKTFSELIATRLGYDLPDDSTATNDFCIAGGTVATFGVYLNNIENISKIRWQNHTDTRTCTLTFYVGYDGNAENTATLVKTYAQIASNSRYWEVEIPIEYYGCNCVKILATAQGNPIVLNDFEVFTSTGTVKKLNSQEYTLLEPSDMNNLTCSEFHATYSPFNITYGSKGNSTLYCWRALAANTTAWVQFINHTGDIAYITMNNNLNVTADLRLYVGDDEDNLVDSGCTYKTGTATSTASTISIPYAYKDKKIFRFCSMVAIQSCIYNFQVYTYKNSYPRKQLINTDLPYKTGSVERIVNFDGNSFSTTSEAVVKTILGSIQKQYEYQEDNTNVDYTDTTKYTTNTLSSSSSSFTDALLTDSNSITFDSTVASDQWIKFELEKPTDMISFYNGTATNPITATLYVSDDDSEYIAIKSQIVIVGGTCELYIPYAYRSSSYMKIIFSVPKVSTSVVTLSQFKLYNTKILQDISIINKPFFEGNLLWQYVNEDKTLWYKFIGNMLIQGGVYSSTTGFTQDYITLPIDYHNTNYSISFDKVGANSDIASMHVISKGTNNFSLRAIQADGYPNLTWTTIGFVGA